MTRRNGSSRLSSANSELAKKTFRIRPLLPENLEGKAMDYPTFIEDLGTEDPEFRRLVVKL